MDDTAELLDRISATLTEDIWTPPVSAIEAEARRRAVLRSLTSLTVVLVMVVGLVVGLASVGMASERSPRSQSVTAAAQVP